MAVVFVVQLTHLPAEVLRGVVAWHVRLLLGQEYVVEVFVPATPVVFPQLLRTVLVEAQAEVVLARRFYVALKSRPVVQPVHGVGYRAQARVGQEHGDFFEKALL